MKTTLVSEVYPEQKTYLLRQFDVGSDCLHRVAVRYRVVWVAQDEAPYGVTLIGRAAHTFAKNGYHRGAEGIDIRGEICQNRLGFRRIDDVSRVVVIKWLRPQPRIDTDEETYSGQQDALILVTDRPNEGSKQCTHAWSENGIVSRHGPDGVASRYISG